MEILKKEFRHHYSEYGHLVFVEGGEYYDVPFDIKRVYYITDVPEGVRRGFHAHKKLEQYLICVHGQCTILLDDGYEQTNILLNDPKEGLHVGPGMWREMYDFSEGAVLLVLASEHYEESDYIRNYEQFLEYKGLKNEN